MSNLSISICLILLLAVFNAPIWLALVGGSIPYFLFLQDGMSFTIVAQRMLATMESTSYLAIPFFITAGSIMNYAGISKRLLDLADGLVGHLPGGLAHVNCLLSVLMGGISGSAAADAAMESKVLVPEMIAHGYDKNFSAAVTVASSLLTPIIPPGIGMIILGFVTNTSIGKLFCAGYVPGILGMIMMMIYSGFVAKKKGYGSGRTERAKGKELWKLFADGFWALIMPFGIILGMRFGLCTASEAGALCCWYSLIIGALVYRELKVKDIVPIFEESVIGTSTTMILICGANVFAYLLTFENVTNNLVAFITSMNLSKTAFLLLLNVLLLLIGMFLEGGAPMIVLGPLLMPVAKSLGIDPVHFCIVFVFNLGIGNMSPPFGLVLYQVCGLLDIDLWSMAKACFPFIIIMIIDLMIITFLPDLVLWIPNLVYG